MWKYKFIWLALCFTLMSCSIAIQKQPMSLCENQNRQSINEQVLNSALIKTQSWANATYGKSCVTCAEIYSVEKESFTLHITSPGDLLINTSATIEFENETAKVLNKSIYHSCHVRYKN